MVKEERSKDDTRNRVVNLRAGWTSLVISDLKVADRLPLIFADWSVDLERLQSR